MMNISKRLENELLTILMEGRIDSANSAEAESLIEAARQENAHTEIVLDMDELEYISSAGLRVILRLRKNEPTLKIVNASSEVYEILEMTGFAEMIPVSKAYRKLSVDGCEVIAQGANGKVYRYDSDTIVKVYFNADALQDIHRERELARRAFVLGIPTAIPYDVVRVGDGYGSVFEMLNAKSFAKLIAEEPEKLDEYIGLYVELLRKIHETTVRPEDMPDQREVVIGWAKFVAEYLPEDKGAKLIRLVEEVPVSHQMMHGDYRIKNVMMQNGEVLLIDMDTLCQGHPVFELASVYNAYVGFSYLDHGVVQDFLGIDYETSVRIWKKTLPLYLETEEAQKVEAVEKKVMLIGFTRLMRRLIRRGGLENEEGRKYIEVYKQQITELLDQVDSLAF